MKVNGLDVKMEEPVDLYGFLSSQGFNPAHVAVERNGNVIPKNEYTDTMLYDGDILEIVRFVGGG